MNENTPELNKEKAPSNGSEAGSEFYEQAQVKPRTWRTEAEMTQKVDQVEPIINPNAHREAGVALDNEIPTDKRVHEMNTKILNFNQKVEKVEEVRTSKASPNKMMETLAQLHDQEAA